MVSPSLTNAYNRTEIEKLVTHRTWKSTLRGAGCGQRGRTATHALTRVRRWTASGFSGKPNWSTQTTKSRVWVRFAGFSSEGYPVGKALGRQIVYHCDSAAVSRVCSQEVSVSSKPLHATCHTKGAEAVMLWKSSARLSTAAFIKKRFRPSGKNGGRPWPFGYTLMGSPSLSPRDLTKIFFFNVDHFFLSFYWICYNTVSVLLFFCHIAYGILVLWPGIKLQAKY